MESRPDIVENISEQVKDGGQPKVQPIDMDKDDLTDDMISDLNFQVLL